MIGTDDPDEQHSMYWHRLADVPTIRTEGIKKHTPLMLVYAKYEGEASKFHQRGWFVCPTDADLERVQAVRQQALDAKAAFDAVLHELGTYDRALHDGRYLRKAEPPAPAAPEPVARDITLPPYPVADVDRFVAEVSRVLEGEEWAAFRAAHPLTIALLRGVGRYLAIEVPEEKVLEASA